MRATLIIGIFQGLPCPVQSTPLGVIAGLLIGFITNVLPLITCLAVILPPLRLHTLSVSLIAKRMNIEPSAPIGAITMAPAPSAILSAPVISASALMVLRWLVTGRARPVTPQLAIILQT